MLPDAEQLVAQLTEHVRPLISQPIALVGIHSGGAWVAQRIQQALGAHVPLGTLDPAFYRDDFDRVGLRAKARPSRIDFDVEGRHILLVDDVLYTGRTIRGAMNELFDYGRPGHITLAVLVDRGGRELPVAAQIVGARIDLPATQTLDLARDSDGKLHFVLREVS